MARLASSRLTAHGSHSGNSVLQLKLIQSGKFLQQIARKSTKSAGRAPRPPARTRVGRWWGSGAGRVLEGNVGGQQLGGASWQRVSPVAGGSGL